MRALIAILALALAGCGDKRVLVEHPAPQRAAVPVAVGCVSGDRPAESVALQDRYTAEQWNALTPKQKAALIGAQALARQSYGQAIAAATGACR